jgi:hypothetical protein
MATTVPKLGKLAVSRAALFVCDVQERFRSIITGFPAVIDTSRRMVGVYFAGCLQRAWLLMAQLASRLLLLSIPLATRSPTDIAQVRGATALKVPIFVTEQYRKALGSTVTELLEELPKGTPIVDKTKFSMYGEKKSLSSGFLYHHCLLGSQLTTRDAVLECLAIPKSCPALSMLAR